MEQEIVNINDEQLAIICPHTDEPCENEACYDSHVCVECGEKVLPERRAA